jgi:deazaflavin-dependent oxidoreductase (nitroreductase family)
MFRSKPRGFTKWMNQMPIWVYRSGLGFLMGSRFLMIEHRGRRSGQLYRTVLEVVGHDPDTNEWFSSSGWGPNADWYRNLQAGKFEALWLGSERYADAVFRFVDVDEAADIIELYESEHPKTAAALFKGMAVFHDGTHAGRTTMMEQIPMVAFGSK